jgi:hypothetical protein
MCVLVTADALRVHRPMREEAHWRQRDRDEPADMMVWFPSDSWRAEAAMRLVWQAPAAVENRWDAGKERGLTDLVHRGSRFSVPKLV